MKRFFLGVVVLLGVLTGGASANAAPKAMIIFDASGSMWGQIDGVNKIVIARDALKSVVQKWNPKVELGLTVYGHRVKGDCNDIQTVIPIGKINKKQMIDTVYSIMPKGMTPIAKSLRQVANTFRQYEGQTTIILISDGRESCEADPCATAKQLKAEGINFVAHVVGFNVDANTDRQLACVAKATGGEYFSAKNAAALNKAIKVIAKKVAKPKPKPKPKPAIKKPKNNVEITASALKDGAQIEASFEIYSTGGKKLTDTYKTYIDKPRIFTIPVGKYRIKMHRGDLKKEAQFIAPIDGVAKIHVVMGSTGKVSVTASETKGGKWVFSNCRAYNSDETDSWGVIPRKNKAGVKQLPVGKYTLKCSYNAFKKELPFEIKAGETRKIHVIFEQFRIETKCTDRNAMVSYEVYATNGQMIFDTKQPCTKPLQLTLDAGKYNLEAKLNGNTKKAKFTVGGDNKVMQLDLTNLNHEVEIQADKQTLAPKPKSIKPKLQEQLQQLDQAADMILKSATKGADEHKEDIKKVGELLNTLGGLFGNNSAASRETKKSKIKQTDQEVQKEKSDKAFDEAGKDLEMFTK